MEDAATADIPLASLTVGGVAEGHSRRRPQVSAELVRPVIAERLVKVEASITAQGEDTTYDQAAVIFDKMSLTPEYPEFPTLPLYEAIA